MYNSEAYKRTGDRHFAEYGVALTVKKISQTQYIVHFSQNGHKILTLVPVGGTFNWHVHGVLGSRECVPIITVEKRPVNRPADTKGAIVLCTR